MLYCFHYRKKEAKARMKTVSQNSNMQEMRVILVAMLMLCAGFLLLYLQSNL